jgi:hypothetical protein
MSTDITLVSGPVTDSNVSEIARFLLHRPDRTFGWMHIWGPPEHDEAWYARMRADPAVKALVETFSRVCWGAARVAP